MGTLFVFIIGFAVSSFVHIMWGHKNRKMLGKARSYMQRTGEKIFD